MNHSEIEKYKEIIVERMARSYLEAYHEEEPIDPNTIVHLAHKLELTNLFIKKLMEIV